MTPTAVMLKVEVLVIVWWFYKMWSIWISWSCCDLHDFAGCSSEEPSGGSSERACQLSMLSVKKTTTSASTWPCSSGVCVCVFVYTGGLMSVYVCVSISLYTLICCWKFI